MIVGLEFDKNLDLVVCRLFGDDSARGGAWARGHDRPRSHVRSLYSVSLAGLPRTASPLKLARRALRTGRLIADTQIAVSEVPT